MAGVLVLNSDFFMFSLKNLVSDIFKVLTNIDVCIVMLDASDALSKLQTVTLFRPTRSKQCHCLQFAFVVMTQEGGLARF